MADLRRYVCGRHFKDKILQVSMSSSIILSFRFKFKGHFLYIVDILCYVEWCIRLLALTVFYHTL